jgi:hypothetical protein
MFKSKLPIFLLLLFFCFSTYILLLRPAAIHAGNAVTRQTDSVSLNAHNEAICGFNPLGAEEEISKHKLHTLNLQKEKSSLVASSLPRVNIVGDIAVIEDDGSIVMPANDFDMNKSSLLFTPDGSGYRVSRNTVGFTKDFGTKLDYFFGIDNVLLSDANNGYREISFDGTPFSFFGINYDKFFVGTNGYITFNQGDATSRISAAALASEMPRIAPLWADLDITSIGGVYHNRLPDRQVITWDGAPQAQYPAISTFQLVLYNDGRIAFVYRKVKARNALVGISPGGLSPGSQPMDFSNAQNELITTSVFESFSKQKRIDIPAFTRAFYTAQPDAFDTLYMWTDFAFDNGPGYATSFNVRNDIRGIGSRIFDKGAIYGSPAQLSSIALIGDAVGSWPDDPNAEVAGLFSAVKIVCHEQGHRWLSYVRFKTNRGASDDLLGRDLSHWSFLMDTRTTSEGTFSSLMEGNAWRTGAGGSFLTVQTAANYFSELDQYLMGLRAPEEVNTLSYLNVPDDVQAKLRFGSPLGNFSIQAEKRDVSIEQIIAQEGARIPDVANSPKNFRIAFVLLTEHGTNAANKTINKLDNYRSTLVRYFSTATSRRGALDSTLLQN